MPSTEGRSRDVSRNYHQAFHYLLYVLIYKVPYFKAIGISHFSLIATVNTLSVELRMTHAAYFKDFSIHL